MIKKLSLIFLTVTLLLSCSDKKKDDLNRLSKTMKNIELALKSDDRDLINLVLADIEYLMPKFPKHQSLREKRYKLQIHIKDYDGAISTIDSLLIISPEDIDNRIVQGILLEIVGSKAQSIEVFEKALVLIDLKIERMLPGAREKRFKRELNRMLILKLLNRDSEEDYNRLENSDLAKDYKDIAKVLQILKLSDREQYINRYR